MSARDEIARVLDELDKDYDYDSGHLPSNEDIADAVIAHLLSDEVVERGAIGCLSRFDNEYGWTAEDWKASWMTEGTRDTWRGYSRAALQAALGVDRD